MEGVFPPQRSTHPFRIIENDTISIQSMTSLGRVGRILAGTDVVSTAGDRDAYSSSSGNVSTSTVTPDATSIKSLEKNKNPIQSMNIIQLQGNDLMK